MPPKEILDLGLTGLALIVVWKVLDFAKWVLLKKQGVSSNGTPLMSALACQMDPQHFAHIKEVHEMMSDAQDTVKTDHATLQALKRQAEQGGFCAWHGRDEVRDLLELMRTLVTEIRGLRGDLNGHAQ